MTTVGPDNRLVEEGQPLERPVNPAVNRHGQQLVDMPQEYGGYGQVHAEAGDLGPHEGPFLVLHAHGSSATVDMTIVQGYDAQGQAETTVKTAFPLTPGQPFRGPVLRFAMTSGVRVIGNKAPTASRSLA